MLPRYSLHECILGGHQKVKCTMKQPNNYLCLILFCNKFIPNCNFNPSPIKDQNNAGSTPYVLTWNSMQVAWGKFYFPYWLTTWIFRRLWKNIILLLTFSVMICHSFLMYSNLPSEILNWFVVSTSTVCSLVLHSLSISWHKRITTNSSFDWSNLCCYW